MNFYIRRLLWMGFWIIVLIILVSAAAANGISRNQWKIQCEDGDKFIIEKKIAIETVNIPVVKDQLIIVDTKKLRLYFYHDRRKLESSYPVAIGKPATPSPIGEWKIIHKGGNWGDGFGVRWIGINVPWGIYGIHGTDKPGSIGYRESHGCIRMYNRDVLKLYEQVKLGTPVRIIGDLSQVPVRKKFYPKCTGKDVVVVQLGLRKAGFNPGPADGRFGPQMEKAVLRLQYFFGLNPTGKVGLDEQYLIGLRNLKAIQKGVKKQ